MRDRPDLSHWQRVRAQISEDRHLLIPRPSFPVHALSYDEYWAARGGPSDSATLSIWQAYRVARLVAHLMPGDSVLDLGCGGSGTLNAIRARVPIIGIGADISHQALERLEHDGYAAHRVDLRDPASLDALPEVDYVLCFELLEHLPEPELIVASLSSKVRKGIWISVPNSGYWVYRLRTLLGRMPRQWIRHPGEHLRFWTLSDLHWWTRVLGHALPVELHDLDVYRGWPWLRSIWPSMFGMAFLFLLVRRPDDLRAPTGG